MTLRLRPLRPGDETAFAAGHRAMAADDFVFGLGYETRMEWTSYLATLSRQRHGEVPVGGLVPATFLVADVGSVIVGRTSIRHMLTGSTDCRGTARFATVRRLSLWGWGKSACDLGGYVGRWWRCSSWGRPGT